jgi:hypothetical protein
MSDTIDIREVQCFAAWTRHLTRLELLIAIHITIRSWCEGREEAEIEPARIAAAYEVHVWEIEQALESMRAEGALKKLTWTRGGTAAVVSLTPRWRMDEEARDV